MEVRLLTKLNKNTDLDLQDNYNVNSKQQSFTDLKTRYDNLVSFNDVDNTFLSREETFPMKTNLDTGENIIHNVKNDTNVDGVVNKGYVDQADNSLQNNIDLKSDKSYVDYNIKNLNTKIINTVLHITETDEK